MDTDTSCLTLSDSTNSRKPVLFRMPAIDHVPSEILAEIFLHCRPPNSVGFDDDRQRISLVCRRWRTLTLAFPALWASFSIKCSPRYLSPPLHIIRTWILRSGTHPLTFALDTAGLDDSPSSRNPQFPAVLASLAAARETWCCVSIRLAPAVMRETLDMIAGGDAPLLQTFKCSIYTGIPQSRLRVPRECPQLRSLTWWNFNGLLHPPLENPAWGRLTSMCINATLTTSDCFTFIRYSPRLFTARFSEINSLGDHSSYLIHTTLHTLDIRGTHSISLLDIVVLPALVELELRVIPGPQSVQPREELYAFLSRSAPPLHHLSITDLHLPEPTLLRALALTTDLRSLTIRELRGHREPSTAAFIRALQPPLPLCPRLLILEIPVLDCPDGVLGAMLRARWDADARANGVASLGFVRIEMLGDTHERDMRTMQELKAEGLGGLLYSKS